MKEIHPVNLLGITTRMSNEHEVEVLIPLSQNYNDKGIQFAGSLFSGAVFAGYRLVQNRMAIQDISGTLVCKKADIGYRIPLTTDAVARATAIGNFSPTRGGNRQIDVTVSLCSEQNEQCAEAHFVFVVMNE
jgi:thioesterase domain-containing protein